MANEQTRTSRRNSPSSSKKTSQTRNKTSGKGSGHKKRGLFIRIILILFSLICIAFLAGVGLFWFYAKDAPKLMDTALDATVSSKLYTQNGELFEDLGAEKEKRLPQTNCRKR